jgi:hypothetical protein
MNLSKAVANRTVIYSLAGVAVAALFLAIFFVLLSADKTQSFFFDGSLASVDGDGFLIVRGKYALAGLESQYSNDFVDVQVAVAADTKIIRQAFKVPSQEELKKTNGQFFPERIPKEESVSDIQQLIKDSANTTIGIYVKASSNIYGKTRIKAEEIRYITPIFGDEEQ